MSTDNLTHSRRPIAVLVGKKRFESIGQAAKFLSKETGLTISPVRVRTAIVKGNRIGGLTVKTESPLPPRKKKQGRGFEDRKIKKALADLGELGTPIEGEAKPLAIHEHVKGTPLLIYPPGAGPLYRGRRML